LGFGFFPGIIDRAAFFFANVAAQCEFGAKEEDDNLNVSAADMVEQTA
jgi:hypothetical protein